MAWVAEALLDLDITDGTHVPRAALTRVGGNAILAHTVVARWRIAVVDVFLTKQTSEAFCTFTVVSIGSVDTFGSVQTGGTGTLIYVDLTRFSTKSCWALANKTADLVHTFTLVQTRGAPTLVNVNFTMSPLKSGHADAGVFPDAIQTSAVVQTGV